MEERRTAKSFRFALQARMRHGVNLTPPATHLGAGSCAPVWSSRAAALVEDIVCNGHEPDSVWGPLPPGSGASDLRPCKQPERSGRRAIGSQVASPRAWRECPRLRARAAAEGVSVEVYFRRKLGLPDNPPPEGTSDKTHLPGNDNREQLYRDMAHVKFFASVWKVSPAEVVQTAADAIDDCYSWEDIQYEVAATLQQSEKILRRMRAGKALPPGAVARVFTTHAWMLLLVGEIARRDGSIDAIRGIAAEAARFQKTLDEAHINFDVTSTSKMI